MKFIATSLFPYRSSRTVMKTQTDFYNTDNVADSFTSVRKDGS